MKTYKLFYSWQTDKQETKKIIREALDKAIAKLKVKGIDIYVDQDTRDRIGTTNIDSEVLNKIKNCDIFLADLSPVTKYGNSKLVPNSNVIFEYGYAKALLGMERCILVASLEQGESLANMPFDINHDTISTFHSSSDLEGLHSWINKITQYVDELREREKVTNNCKILFQNYSEKTTLFPKFIRYCRDFADTKDCDICFLDSWENHKPPYFKTKGAICTPLGGTSENYSLCPVHLNIINDGHNALENCEVTLTLGNSEARFEENNFKSYNIPEGIHFINDPQEIYHDHVFQRLGDINPEAQKEIDVFYIHLTATIREIVVNWKMTSKYYSQEGSVTISIEPQFKDIVREDTPDNMLIITDYIVDK